MGLRGLEMYKVLIRVGLSLAIERAAQLVPQIPYLYI